MAKILHEAADRANSLLTEHRAELEKLSDALEEQEVLDEMEIEQLLGPSINKRPDTNGRMVDVAPTAKGSDAQPTHPAKNSAPEE